MNVFIGQVSYIFLTPTPSTSGYGALAVVACTAGTFSPPYTAVSGYQDGTYLPKIPVSRGAIAKMVLLSMQTQGSLVEETTKNNPLTDTKGTWSEKYIVPLCKLNVIEAEEYENGFAQQGAMSRLETIKTLVRAYLHAHPDMVLPENLASDFTDKNSISNKDMAYVKLGVELGIINGYPTEDGGVEFRPAEIERGTAAAMIGRFMDKVGTISDHAGTSDVRQDTQLPEVKASNLPVVDTDTRYAYGFVSSENKAIDQVTYDKTVKSSSHYKAVSSFAKEVSFSLHYQHEYIEQLQS